MWISWYQDSTTRFVSQSRYQRTFLVDVLGTLKNLFSLMFGFPQLKILRHLPHRIESKGIPVILAAPIGQEKLDIWMYCSFWGTFCGHYQIVRTSCLRVLCSILLFGHWLWWLGCSSPSPERQMSGWIGHTYAFKCQKINFFFFFSDLSPHLEGLFCMEWMARGYPWQFPMGCVLAFLRLGLDQGLSTVRVKYQPWLFFQLLSITNCIALPGEGFCAGDV